MKRDKKIFILTEMALGIMVLTLAFIIIQKEHGKEPERVSVIVWDSDDNQWDAFKYGLKMAAQDQGVEVFIVNTGSVSTAEEQMDVILDEIENGADAVIVQPAPGADTEQMLKKMENKVPIMLVESTASKEREESVIPTTEPDNYAMGRALAEELLKDYNGNIEGKTLGIMMDISDSEAAVNRRKGAEAVLKAANAEIRWTLSGSLEQEGEGALEKQPKVDVVIALDDGSLTNAAECSAQNNLHGALLYGIGNSTETVYYLDTGIVECLIVPDEFNVGYQSLTETAESLGHYFHRMEDKTVSHAIIRRKELFFPQNQEIIFTMSQ